MQNYKFYKILQGVYCNFSWFDDVNYHFLQHDSSSLYGSIFDTMVGNHKPPSDFVLSCSFQWTKILNSCPNFKIVDLGYTLPSFVSLSMDVSFYNFIMHCPTRAVPLEHPFYRKHLCLKPYLSILVSTFFCSTTF